MFIGIGTLPGRGTKPCGKGTKPTGGTAPGGRLRIFGASGAWIGTGAFVVCACAGGTGGGGAKFGGGAKVGGAGGGGGLLMITGQVFSLLLPPSLDGGEYWIGGILL